LFAVGTGPTCLSEVPVVHHTLSLELCLKTVKIVPRQRVAVNAEGRFLAHWDEFVEHRKEARLATSPRSEFESKLQSLGKLMKTQFGYM